MRGCDTAPRPVHEPVVRTAKPFEGRLAMFVNVRLPDGTVHRLEALEGWRVMEVMRDWGLPINTKSH